MLGFVWLGVVAFLLNYVGILLDSLTWLGCWCGVMLCCRCDLGLYFRLDGIDCLIYYRFEPRLLVGVFWVN